MEAAPQALLRRLAASGGSHENFDLRSDALRRLPETLLRVRSSCLPKPPFRSFARFAMKPLGLSIPIILRA